MCRMSRPECDGFFVSVSLRVTCARDFGLPDDDLKLIGVAATAD
jgi:hypothetical protein